MTSLKLKKLGIERTYDPTSPEELFYLIDINPERLKNPGQAQKYFKRIINKISIDAKKGKGLENLRVSVDDKYLQSLHNVAKDLLKKSEEHRKVRGGDFGDLPLPHKILAGGGAIALGLAGLVLGYDQTTEWATQAADYMNNTSHLWAPVTGVVQTGISIVGTAGATLLGVIGGAMGGSFLIAPYVILKYSLGTKDYVKRYKSLEAALNRTEQSS